MTYVHAASLMLLRSTLVGLAVGVVVAAFSLQPIYMFWGGVIGAAVGAVVGVALAGVLVVAMAWRARLN